MNKKIICRVLLLLLLSRFSRVRLCVTPLTAAHQAPPPLGFSRQEYWSGLPFPSLGDLPHPETEPASLASPALAGRFFTVRATREAPRIRSKDQIFILCYTTGSEKAMAPHSSTLAWRIPGAGEPGGLPSMGSHRVGHD